VEDAVRSFEQSIRLQPNNPEFLQRISELLAQNDRWSDALPYLRRLVLLVPNEPRFKSFLSEAKRQLGLK